VQNLKHSADVADYRGQKSCWWQYLFNCSLANPYLPYYSTTHEAIVPSFRILLMPLNTSFSLHMKCRDAIGVMVVTRWRRQAYLMWLKTRVKNEKIFYVNILLFIDRVFRLVCNSTHTVCQHTQVYDVTLLQLLYLQYGGGNYCWQNDATIIWWVRLRHGVIGLHFGALKCRLLSNISITQRSKSCRLLLRLEILIFCDPHVL